MTLSGRFYTVVADYYQQYKHDLLRAIEFSQRAVSLASSTGNTKRHSQGLHSLARIKWLLGDYSAARSHAYEAQRLARSSADLYREAMALRIEAICWYLIGNYKDSISLLNRARKLVSLCGMSGGNIDHGIMTSLAEAYMFKSEYVEARNLHTQILKKASKDQDVFQHASALLNVAGIDVSMGTPKDVVQNNLDAAKSVFANLGQHKQFMIGADCFQADLSLREGDMLGAKTLLRRSLEAARGKDSEIVSYCLERLGDVNRWSIPHRAPSWTTVFLVHSFKSKEKLGIFKALEFLGDLFLAQDDEDTAICLFTVALEGFTRMDVHRSRGECMLRLGDISHRHDELLKAVEHWTTARPLFEKSSQTKKVEHIDERLAGVGEDVLEQYRSNLAQLAELNLPLGNEEGTNDSSKKEDTEGQDLENEEELDLVVV
jgi:tetratricopeptide (TPR) repeat protein